MRKIAILIGFIIVVVLFALSRMGKLSELEEKQPPLINTENKQESSGENTAPTSNLVPSQEKIINVDGQVKSLVVPEGFEISVFAEDMERPRAFDFDPAGNLYVTDIQAGSVIFISKNGEKNIIAEDLTNPHGIVWHNNDLYVAEETQVIVFRGITQSATFSEKEVLIPELPRGGGHVTRSLAISQDDKIYVSIGSTCNVCEENDPRYAAVVVYNIDGTNEQLYAEGLRNTVGLVLNDIAFGQELWGVDNGRDQIGDDLPVEEVNLIKKGKHYGWPYCHGAGLVNPEFPDKVDFCKHTSEFPTYEMQAHSAPLGLDFAPITFANGLLEDNLVIAFHGSWNRTVPTGYKIVTIDTSKESPVAKDLITGWLQENGQAWGRPVDVRFFDNAMFISDDRAGVIYKVTSK